MSLAIIHPKKTNSSRKLIYTFFIGFVIFIIWAYSFEIERSIRAQGQIIASDKTQVIQTSDGGIIEVINVKEGDRVKKGEILAVLEKERASASYLDTKGKVAALRVSLARLQAEVYGRPLQFSNDLQHYEEFIKNQTDLYKQRKKAIDEDVMTLNESLKLAKEELNMNLPLLRSGDVSKADILKLQRQVTDIQGQITSKRNKYFQDAEAELTKAQEDLATQEQTLMDRKQLLEHTTLIAPVDGIVKKLTVTTIGGVLKQGDEIMQLLPTQSDLIVEAKIQPSDMSNLIKGLPALIKLDAYDYSIYGAMHGNVYYISPDSLTEQTKNGDSVYYRVLVRIKGKEVENNFSKQIKIDPGMTVTIDIKTGNRSVLTYLTKPITKTLSDSLHEK